MLMTDPRPNGLELSSQACRAISFSVVSTEVVRQPPGYEMLLRMSLLRLGLHWVSQSPTWIPELPLLSLAVCQLIAVETGMQVRGGLIGHVADLTPP